MAKTILLSKDSLNNIRYANIEYFQLENSDNYKITRSTGLVGGKDVKQPPLLITEGKANRTIEEQTLLEYNALIENVKNKGYKELSTLTTKLLNELTNEELQSFFTSVKTDSNNNPKPMLAKDTSNAKPAIWNRYYRISCKLDGVRCLMYWDQTTETVRTVSRGGKHYDAASTLIRNNAKLIRLLSKRPNVMLDGELYVHGMSLQEISGIARLKEYDPLRCDVLEFHCYDLAIENLDFQHRLELLEKTADYFYDDPKIKFLEHFEVYGYEEAKLYHDKWVAMGYEGAILRDPTAMYGFGKRDNRMIKLKEFQDDEFEIINYKLGLRGSEDMVFVLTTKDGVEFEAKPIGNRTQKEEYVKNINNIIGKKGTVKYFYLTEEGRPFLPVFKTVRNYE